MQKDQQAYKTLRGVFYLSRQMYIPYLCRYNERSYKANDRTFADDITLLENDSILPSHSQMH